MGDRLTIHSLLQDRTIVIAGLVLAIALIAAFAIKKELR